MPITSNTSDIFNTLDIATTTVWYPPGPSDGFVFLHGQLYAGDLGPLQPTPDPKTFLVSNDGDYSKDSRHVYYFNWLISKADAKTFNPIDYPEPDSDLATDFARDTKHVFYGERIVAGADPNSFTMMEDSMAGIPPDPPDLPLDPSLDIDPTYTKDKNSVFCVDYDSFEVSSLTGADPNTFSMAYFDRRRGYTGRQAAGDSLYGKDRKHIYIYSLSYFTGS